MKPGAGRLRWQGGTSGRVAGAAALLVEAALLVSDPPFGEGWWQWVGWVVGGWWFASVVLSPVTWRITADVTGLWVRGHLRTRHVPWADVTRVVRTPHGELIVRRVAGLDDLSLGVVVLPWWERRLRRPFAATRAAAELTAMVRNPELRP